VARLRLDFRKLLREIANKAQDENLERLLSGRAVDGSDLAERKSPDQAPSKGRASRVRIFGVRVSLRELAGRLGVKTGAMLRDITRRANVKLSRTSFKIVPSPEVRTRWFAFVKGASRNLENANATSIQPARPVSGMTGDLIAEARDQVALEARAQFVNAVNQRRRG